MKKFICTVEKTYIRKDLSEDESDFYDKETAKAQFIEDLAVGNFRIDVEVVDDEGSK